jgi:C-terminal processing protease CtpA/Prc
MTETIIHSEVIRSLAEKLRAYYTFPDAAEKICNGLQKHLDDGDYNDIDEGGFFAYALTTHMQEVCHDEHLWVKWHSEPLPDGDEALRLSKKWMDEQHLQAKLNNYGFYKVERMAGNVGYLDIRYFHRPSWGGDIAVAAMNFLANMDAIIIDLRKCLGGYPGMISLISSYLIREEAVQLGSIYWQDDGTTQQYWTLPYVPGPRLADKPLYILVSRETFSGAEGFAYDMQARKRGIIIGEQTDGGAHPGSSYRLNEHFEAFIPIGYLTHPITKQNWEGLGITPDFLTSSERALKIAHKMILESIIETHGRPSAEARKELLAEVRTAHKELVGE